MANKDFNATENTEHERQSKEPLTSPVSPVEKEVTTEIKNAHATGDGSFGRNDESLPDESEAGEKGEKNVSNHY